MQGVLQWLPNPIDREKVLAAYLESPQVDLAVSEDDSTSGPDAAPVRVVVFSSFQCPGCRQSGQLDAVTLPVARAERHESVADRVAKVRSLIRLQPGADRRSTPKTTP